MKCISKSNAEKGHKLRYSFIFYTEDNSYDVGGIVGTVKDIAYSGFALEISKDDEIDILSLEAFGDYAEMHKKCKTLQQLKDYVESHLCECREYQDYFCSEYNDEEIMQELIEMIGQQIERENNATRNK